MSSPPDQAARQAALDTTRSFIVQAPAGSGKTTLLVDRYLTLLATVQRPEEVLAITFTIKAAAEMRGRVLTRLQDPTDHLALAVRQRDANLGWDISTNPQRLKIQTIDAFAFGLVRKMPVAAAYNLQAQLIEDASPLFDQAAARVLQRIGEDSLTGQAVLRFLRRLDNNESQALKALSEMLQRRDQWIESISEVAASLTLEPERVSQWFNQQLEHLQQRQEQQLLDRLSLRAAQALQDLGEALGQTRAGPIDSAVRSLLTNKFERRKRLTRREGFDSDALKALGRTALESIDDENIDGQLEALARLPAGLSDSAEADDLAAMCIVLAELLAELQNVFREANQSDFTELLDAARRALRENDQQTEEALPTELALALDYQIQHILVDEFQDTSLSQLRLFELLVEGWDAQSNNTFFAVGDPMQSIYRFRDADVKRFKECQQHGIANVPLENLVLEANFRSAAELVHWNNALYGKLALQSRSEVQPAYSQAARGGDAQGDVQLAKFATVEEEVAYLGQALTKLLDRSAADLHREASPARVAVLVRNREHLTPLFQALRQLNIPWRGVELESLARQPIVQDLLSLHRALVNGFDRLAWFSLLRSPLFALTLIELESLKNIKDFSREMQGAAPPIEALHRLRPLLERALADRFEVPARERLERFWFGAGGADAYQAHELRHAEALFNLFDELGFDAEDPVKVTEAAAKLYADDANQAELEIMTIHKAKGLEFDHVFVPFLQRSGRRDEIPLLRCYQERDTLLISARGQSAFEWMNWLEKVAAEEELTRLLYVATTRAKESLTLTFSGDSNPSRGTLAYLLAAGAQVSEPAVETDQAAPSAADQPSLHRLTPGYQWSPPSYATVGGTSQTAEGLSQQQPLQRDTMATAIGQVVHDALYELSMISPLPAADQFLTAREARWRAALRQMGVAQERLDFAWQTVTASVCRTLEDERGRWILSAHDKAAAEFDLTAVVDGQLQRVRLDRTFVAADGVRWIVDYKTGSTEDSPAQVIATYAPQLEKYAKIAELFYNEPIRLALYLTERPLWLPLEPSEDGGGL